MLAIADRASSARIAFGELRYWNTDLAVSQLTLAEQKAAAARENGRKARRARRAGRSQPG